MKFSHPASRYAVIGAAAVVTIAGGTCAAARVAVGGLVPAARARRGRAALTGKARPTRHCCCRGKITSDLGKDMWATSSHRRSIARLSRRYTSTGDCCRGARAPGERSAATLETRWIHLQHARRPPDRRRVAASPCGSSTSPTAVSRCRSTWRSGCKRPLFLEGEAGVGKTEVAKVLASALDAELIRLQCYEGLDVGHAVYEWNYPRQLLEIRLLEGAHALDRPRPSASSSPRSS